ncbi:serine O-acetyltransferase [Modestobacter sp. SYSU DS0511]
MTEQPTPSVRELIREDWETHNRRSTAPGLHALVVHRLQIAVAGRPGPVGKVLRTVLHAVNILLIRNVYGIELFPSTVVGRRLLLPHHAGLVLGEHATIGDDCVIRQHVTLGQQGGSTYDQPTLGDRVDVGPGATIAGAISIGDGATIGAHALVLKNVPAGATAMVSPAKVLPAARPAADRDAAAG